MGAWIETTLTNVGESVDLVAPHVGAWIETEIFALMPIYDESLPMWERGLKRV